jgi:hypothetical protein
MDLTATSRVGRLSRLARQEGGGAPAPRALRAPLSAWRSGVARSRPQALPNPPPHSRPPAPALATLPPSSRAQTSDIVQGSSGTLKLECAGIEACEQVVWYFCESVWMCVGGVRARASCCRSLRPLVVRAGACGSDVRLTVLQRHLRFLVPGMRPVCAVCVCVCPVCVPCVCVCAVCVCVPCVCAVYVCLKGLKNVLAFAVRAVRARMCVSRLGAGPEFGPERHAERCVRACVAGLLSVFCACPPPPGVSVGQ